MEAASFDNSFSVAEHKQEISEARITRCNTSEISGSSQLGNADSALNDSGKNAVSIRSLFHFYYHLPQ